MREIALFVEDNAHQQIIGALIQRMAEEYGIAVRLHWHSATRGYGRVVWEFKEFQRDLNRQGNRFHDLIVVATDANCKGLNERVKEIGFQDAPVLMIHAFPDPHVELWLNARPRFVCILYIAFHRFGQSHVGPIYMLYAMNKGG